MQDPQLEDDQHPAGEPVLGVPTDADAAVDRPPWYQCPECGLDLDANSIGDWTLIECLVCHAQFIPSAGLTGEQEALEAEDTGERERLAAIAAREEELSGLRIRQLSALRRGAYRSRSYSIIAAVALGVACFKLLTIAVRHVRSTGWHSRPVGHLIAVGYAIAIGAGLMAIRFLWRRIVEFTRELNRPTLIDPGVPPDFSTLSDGSQQWKNLEQM